VSSYLCDAARDIIDDPTIVYEEDGIAAVAIDKTIERVVLRQVFGLDGVPRGPVTSMAWSPKYPELMLAAYGKQVGIYFIQKYISLFLFVLNQLVHRCWYCNRRMLVMLMGMLLFGTYI
jgi:hypothetical protein